MESKIIKKLLAYAKDHEILDLAITQKDGHHILWGENELGKHQIKLPSGLENELGLAFRHLLSFASTDLVSGSYLKTSNGTFRLSIIPDGDDEKIIINTVPKSKKLLSLPRLGLGRDERHEVENFLLKRRGLIIVSANDNQGKTTTLYSLLNKIDRDRKSCYSIEKFSHLELDGVNQLIGNDKRRLSDLNEILKTNSDVIMIDDASDELLAESLVATRTGRLLFLGLKAENAAAAITKVMASVKNEDLPILIIFQKLLSKNCPHCLQAYVISESEELISKYWPSTKNYTPKHFFTSRGCPKCKHTGIKDQIAIFNLSEINHQEINVLSSLASDVLQKAANGLISMSNFITEHRSAKINKL